ncbi:c-type cytochrome [Rhodobium gokarnense]|uniref:Cytochrome c553 n=1 Tax=Rhodobium gokarnense TaxID=364296 RepID=A0ABT3H8D0_9HYPH|nr:hypothetical protein [Rhodobium gokarnense]MCW2306657.1 cytochrome c553 [Rhodobium gokarnense]
MKTRFAGTCLAAAVLIAAALLWPGIATAEGPLGEDMRRVAAELIVMRDDAERIISGEDLTERQREALAARVRGAASYLPLLLRKADGNRRSDEIAALRAALAEPDWSTAIGILARLSETYPFDATGLRPPADAEEAAKFGQTLHEAYCISCHEGGENPDWLPIPNLFEMAKTMPEERLLPRFYNGIRGDASTALAQPMSAGDIAALIAYYRRAPTPE